VIFASLHSLLNDGPGDVVGCPPLSWVWVPSVHMLALLEIVSLDDLTFLADVLAGMLVRRSSFSMSCALGYNTPHLDGIR
jgi:hypothetical protein